MAILKKILPKKIREKLRLIHMFVFKSNDEIKVEIDKTRQWGISINIDDEQKDEFINNIFLGKISYNQKTSYTNVLLCAQPKSASLYITQLISSTFNYTNHQIGFAKKSGDIYYPRMLAVKYIDSNSISHSHSAPTPDVIKLIKTLDLKVIVLYRNLLDSLVSRLDMLIKDGWAQNFLSSNSIKNFQKLDFESQLTTIIHLYADDYLNFYTSWKDVKAKNILNPLFITYDELIDNEMDMVKKVGNFLGEDFDEERFNSFRKNINENGGINFNKGISGRGKKVFNENHIALLKEKANIFQCFDEEYCGFKI